MFVRTCLWNQGPCKGPFFSIGVHKRDAHSGGDPFSLRRLVSILLGALHYADWLKYPGRRGRAYRGSRRVRRRDGCRVP